MESLGFTPAVGDHAFTPQQRELLTLANRLGRENFAPRAAKWDEEASFPFANYDDLRDQLGELLRPGFVRDTLRARLAHFPRYLRAMKLRAERLRQDPARDQARMLGVQLYWREYLKLRATRGDEAELEELRWLVEKLRVSTFAQELRTAESVSPKRLGKLVEGLRASASTRAT